MRWTLLLLGLLFVTFLPAHAGHTPPKIVFRVHVQSPGAGLSALEVTTIAVPPNGEQIQIRTAAECTEQQIIGVAQDANTLRIQFNHVGMVDLNAVTAQNQGRILVVIINGAVLYAPVIDQQITNGELDIPHPVNPAILKLLQDTAAENVRKASRT